MKKLLNLVVAALFTLLLAPSSALAYTESHDGNGNHYYSDNFEDYTAETFPSSRWAKQWGYASGSHDIRVRNKNACENNPELTCKYLWANSNNNSDEKALEFTPPGEFGSGSTSYEIVARVWFYNVGPSSESARTTNKLLSQAASGSAISDAYQTTYGISCGVYGVSFDDGVSTTHSGGIPDVCPANLSVPQGGWHWLRLARVDGIMEYCGANDSTTSTEVGHDTWSCTQSGTGHGPENGFVGWGSLRSGSRALDVFSVARGPDCDDGECAKYSQ